MLYDLLVCFFLGYCDDRLESGFLNDFRIRRALEDLFLNDPGFIAFGHIYVEKDDAKPFKAISQCK